MTAVTMRFLAGKSVIQALEIGTNTIIKEMSNIFMQIWLVSLGHQQIITPLVHDLLSNLLLAAKCINRYQSSQSRFSRYSNSGMAKISLVFSGTAT